jgi:hypothetical protein
MNWPSSQSSEVQQCSDGARLDNWWKSLMEINSSSLGETMNIPSSLASREPSGHSLFLKIHFPVMR